MRTMYPRSAQRILRVCSFKIDMQMTMGRGDLPHRAEQTQLTIYLVAGLFMAIGLTVTGYGAFGANDAQHVLIAIAGLLMVGLAPACAAILLAIYRLEERFIATARRFDHLRESFGRREALPLALAEDERVGSMRLFDLAASSPANRASLISAVLDRSVFPRLVASANENSGEPQHFDQDNPASLTRRWEVAIRKDDLRTARLLHAPLSKIGAPEAARKLVDDLDALVHREARRLRTSFAGYVRDRDYVGALAIGEEIVRLLPDHSLAVDFTRIKPHLQRRVESAVLAGQGQPLGTPQESLMVGNGGTALAFRSVPRRVPSNL